VSRVTQGLLLLLVGAETGLAASPNAGANPFPAPPIDKRTSVATAAAGGRRMSAHGAKAHIVELFSRRFNLDDDRGLNDYIHALDAELERSKRDEPLGKEHEKDPVHHKAPRNFISSKVRHAMELTRDAAKEVAAADSEHRASLLRDVLMMADAVNGCFERVYPYDMDVLKALMRERTFRHPPVGLGNSGAARNLSGSAAEPDKSDPFLPSSFWNKPKDIGALDLYYGFGRTALPNLDGIVCTYKRSKQSLGTHAGFDVKCKELGTVKLKFGEEFSQPVSHRIFWALGFNTIPDDCVRSVSVKWDPRILTEFNTRQDETISVTLFGVITVHTEHLQHYIDPLKYVSEVVMRDETGKQVILRPNPDWNKFKKQLYKKPNGRPETVADNFNEAFANRIQILKYRNVNIQLKDDDDDTGDEVFVGNWDWNAPGNSDLRETRGFAFLSAWLNQYDSVVHNNKLMMVKKEDGRSFTHYVTDLGGCLGTAADGTKADSELPNEFPWAFTRPAQPGSNAIPLDGSFHNIRENETFRCADVFDARWISRYMAQLSGKQILDALMSTGMPSAHVRVFYNKLVSRRNKALKDIGLDYPPIEPLDESDQFDYDPPDEDGHQQRRDRDSAGR
jgi:hypothetical protein